MAAKALPSAEVLRQLLHYDPETGRLFWKPRPAEMFATSRAFGLWNTRFAGKPAFCLREKRGHLAGKLFGERYKAHRVIWSIVNGCDPTEQIDHINGDPSDNRIANLREATQRQNCQNRRSRIGSSSKYLGVNWHGHTQKWVAAIGAKGIQSHIGVYDTEYEAAVAYDAAAKKYHGEFARLNFPE